MYVTEDTTRADPETLRALYSTAIRAGASRVCIADTVGHATPAGAAAVVALRRVAWSTSAAAASASTGTATATATSPSSTARRARSGRDAAARRGARHRRARRQHADGSAARQSRADGLPRARSDGAGRVLRGRVRRRPACRSRPNYPVVGATRSGRRPACTPRRSSRRSGRSDRALMDAVYSAVPASLVGREQEIEVGPMSGQVERRVLAGEARACRRPTSDRRPSSPAAKASASVLTRAGRSSSELERSLSRWLPIARAPSSISGSAASSTSPTACRLPRADVVERVVARVCHARGVVEVDDVDGGHAGLEERE